MIKGRPPRLPVIFQSTEQPLFFVTLCTLHRRPFADIGVVHDTFLSYARRAEQFGVAVGRYVVMPDHVHLFVCGGLSVVLGDWVKGLKRSIHNALPEPKPAKLWQPGFFDHILRSDESYSQKWEYVRVNPVRGGLVATPDEWPYSGEVVLVDRV